MPQTQIVIVKGVFGTYSWTDGFRSCPRRDEFLASVRNRGWHFVDQLVEKAARLEAAGHFPSAEMCLSDALRAEKILSLEAKRASR